jgi:H+-translocating NAD(P) transhydrogenase subunit alpha
VPEKPEPKAKLTPRGKVLLTAAGIAALLFVAATAPPDLTGHLMVLVLSVVIGYYVIGNVAHALHTPLMSVTNAISGVIVVGALLQVGSHDVATRVLATIAILLASINVFGGFAVTRRMLSMFSKG